MKQVYYFETHPQHKVWVKDVEVRDGKILFESEWYTKE